MKFKLLKFFNKEKNVVILSIIIGIIIYIFFLNKTKVYSDNIQNGIAEEVIRFHVLANSDKDFDQQLKINVKNEIVKMLETMLKNSKSKEETKSMLIDNLTQINEKAKQIVKENGFDYDVKTLITKSYFPTKVYGDIRLPAGEYEALKIIIGSGKGENWWCVMFPPLCFVDATFKEVPIKDKVLLKNVLTEEEYKIVYKNANKNDIPIEIKFKIVEWWQKLNKKS